MNRTQQMNLFRRERPVICQLRINFNFWGTICFGNGTWQFSFCLNQSWSLRTLFVCRYLMSFLGKKLLLSDQTFHCLVIAAIQLELVYIIGEVFGVVSKTRQSPNFVFSMRNKFLLSPMFQLILNRLESEYLQLLFSGHYKRACR